MNTMTEPTSPRTGAKRVTAPLVADYCATSVMWSYRDTDDSELLADECARNSAWSEEVPRHRPDEPSPIVRAASPVRGIAHPHQLARQWRNAPEHRATLVLGGRVRWLGRLRVGHRDLRRGYVAVVRIVSARCS